MSTKKKPAKPVGVKRLVSLWCFRDGAMTREAQITIAFAEKLTRQKLDARRCWCVLRHGRKYEPHFWCKVAKMWVPQANNAVSDGAKSGKADHA